MRNIADNYQCDISDITSNNLHITDFKNLRPGMKLKIPFLTKPVIDTLEETESFITDYYPSLKKDFVQSKEEPVIAKEIKEEIKEEIIEEKVVEIKKDLVQEKRNVEIKPYGAYYGNIVPDVPKQFIKKI